MTEEQQNIIQASLRYEWTYQAGRVRFGTGTCDDANRVYTTIKVRELIAAQPYCAPGCTFQVIIKGLPLKVVSHG